MQRVLHELKREWYHAWQHIYMWGLYLFTTAFWTISNMAKLLLARKYNGKMWEGIVEVEHKDQSDWNETIFSISFNIFYRMILPFLCLPFGQALTVALIAEMVCSFWFALQFAVSHEVIECVEDKEDFMNGKKTIDWGTYQLISAHNYDEDGLLSLHFSGGLNCQIEHHLFPSVHYVHYPALAKIVKQTCKEFGLPYVTSPNVLGALQKHQEALKFMGANN